MQLLTIQDPRTPLERARRPELVAFARSHGLLDINENMPAILIRKKLRERGLTNINVPDRPLGIIHGNPTDHPTDDAANVIDHEAALEHEYERQKPVHLGGMTRAQLAKECKQRGIKMSRTDSKEKLMERLNGEQNAS